jgi:hypothetical protein
MHQQAAPQQQFEAESQVSTARWRRDVLRHSNLKPTERLVAMALADYMNATGDNCAPSHEGIAKRTGLHRNAIGRALRNLDAAGWVDVERPAKPNQHQRSTYRPKNPTTIVELRDGCTTRVHAQKGVHALERCMHSRGACTPRVHKVERPVEPKGETGSLQSPVSTNKPNGGRLEEPEAPRRPSKDSSTTSKNELLDGLSRQEPSSAVTDRLEWLDTLERKRTPSPNRSRR